MLEKWKSTIDNGKIFGALLTELSKAFDWISHELIIAKFNAYRFTLPALNLIKNYLKSRRSEPKLTIHLTLGKI